MASAQCAAPEHPGPSASAQRAVLDAPEPSASARCEAADAPEPSASAQCTLLKSPKPAARVLGRLSSQNGQAPHQDDQFSVQIEIERNRYERVRRSPDRRQIPCERGRRKLETLPPRVRRSKVLPRCALRRCARVRLRRGRATRVRRSCSAVLEECSPSVPDALGNVPTPYFLRAAGIVHSKKRLCFGAAGFGDFSERKSWGEFPLWSGSGPGSRRDALPRSSHRAPTRDRSSSIRTMGGSAGQSTVAG